MMNFSSNLGPLTNKDLDNWVKKLDIKNCRGVFMRDTLPKKIKNIECGIINLDSINGCGTHWTCYHKNENQCYYFDSFGLDPPIELCMYLNSEIDLSTFQIQEFNTHHCGYYCLVVLKLLETYDYKDVILSLL